MLTFISNPHHSPLPWRGKYTKIIPQDPTQLAATFTPYFLPIFKPESINSNFSKASLLLNASIASLK